MFLLPQLVPAFLCRQRGRSLKGLLSWYCHRRSPPTCTSFLAHNPVLPPELTDDVPPRTTCPVTVQKAPSQALVMRSASHPQASISVPRGHNPRKSLGCCQSASTEASAAVSCKRQSVGTGLWGLPLPYVPAQPWLCIPAFVSSTTITEHHCLPGTRQELQTSLNESEVEGWRRRSS